jgi:hypothetical protein
MPIIFILFLANCVVAERYVFYELRKHYLQGKTGSSRANEIYRRIKLGRGYIKFVYSLCFDSFVAGFSSMSLAAISVNFTWIELYTIAKSGRIQHIAQTKPFLYNALLVLGENPVLVILSYLSCIIFLFVIVTRLICPFLWKYMEWAHNKYLLDHPHGGRRE